MNGELFDLNEILSFTPEEIERTAMCWLDRPLPDHEAVCRLLTNAAISVTRLQYWDWRNTWVAQGRIRQTIPSVRAEHVVWCLRPSLQRLGFLEEGEEARLSVALNHTYLIVVWVSPRVSLPGELRIVHGRPQYEAWPSTDAAEIA